MFECSLRPDYLELKEMSVEGTKFQPSTGLILPPHLVPHLFLIKNINKRTIFRSLFYQRDSMTDSDKQLSKHLQSYFTKENVETLRSNANNLLLDSNVTLDETLLDLFRTEYHIRLHWGSQSRFILLLPKHSDERHEEFDKVLTTLFGMCSMQQHGQK